MSYLLDNARRRADALGSRLCPHASSVAVDELTTIKQQIHPATHIRGQTYERAISDP